MRDDRGFARLGLGPLAGDIDFNPLATNIAAVTFISKKIMHPLMVFISGFAYTLRCTAAYAVLGWLIIHSLLSIPQVAQFLQTHMGKMLGPLLIISGLFLLEAIGLSLSQEHHNNLVESGAPGPLF